MQQRTRRKYRWVATALAAAVGLVLAVATTGVSPVSAAPIPVADDGGPDDQPGQKDLNSLVIDHDPATAGTIEVTWNWDYDEADLSGGNTADACSLVDTDDDGNANFALCVLWGDDGDDGNGTENVYLATRLYQCGDGAADRCDNTRTLLAEDLNRDGDLADAGEALSGGPYASTCSIAFGAADTFGSRTGAQASDVTDAQASCQLVLADFSSADAFLTNVCSYPSQVPGSAPSDCVVTPNRGFLTIEKVADPDDDAVDFTFALPPEATLIEGSGNTPDIQGPTSSRSPGRGPRPSFRSTPAPGT